MNKLANRHQQIIGFLLVAVALAALPWVERVVVRKQWPDTLEILITEHRALARWVERISAREACRRGVSVPRPFEPAEQVYRVKSILLR